MSCCWHWLIEPAFFQGISFLGASPYNALMIIEVISVAVLDFISSFRARPDEHMSHIFQTDLPTSI
jgi:hypothetical protein